MTEEIWKPVFCGENEYKISSNGRIWSCISKRIMKQHTEHCGYSVIKLSGGHGHGKNFFIHKLVAEAFIPNPMNLPQVNHKDENKSSNAVENLEWCTNDYNVSYGTGRLRGIQKRINGKKSKPVLQFNSNGISLAEFPSVDEAARQLGNISKQGNICACCNGTRKTAYGFIWQYK